MVATFLTGCSSDARPPAVRANSDTPTSSTTAGPKLPAILTSSDEPLTLESGPTLETLDVFTAANVVAGDLYWSGMSVVTASGRDPITVLDAEVIVIGGTSPFNVYWGRDGVDGTPGATPIRPPGDTLPGEPVAMLGGTLPPDEPLVLYAVASLDPDSQAGAVVGISLELRSGGQRWSRLVLSPTVLCADKVDVESDACSAVRDELTATIDNLNEGS